jgi:hypothetical protein
MLRKKAPKATLKSAKTRGSLFSTNVGVYPDLSRVGQAFAWAKQQIRLN